MKRKFLHSYLGVIEGEITRQTLFFTYIKLSEPVFIENAGEAELWKAGDFRPTDWIKYTIRKCLQIGDEIKLPTYSMTSLELVTIN